MPRQHIVHTNITCSCFYFSPIKKKNQTNKWLEHIAIAMPLDMNFAWWCRRGHAGCMRTPGRRTRARRQRKGVRTAKCVNHDSGGLCCGSPFVHTNVFIDLVRSMDLDVSEEHVWWRWCPERWHTVTWFTPTQNVTLSTLSKHFLMANISTINMIIIKLF